MKIILASNSPRRRELMAGLGVDFDVKVIPGIEETYPADMPINLIAQHLAMQKFLPYQIGLDDDTVVITADTIVVVDDKVLGKPSDRTEAVEMLRLISGRTHQVITGVCIGRSFIQHAFSVSTDVTFKELTEDEIDYYVDNYKPFDKAGAYGIQEWIGYIGVTGINGSYFNVMGLPVQRIYDELVKLGIV